MPVWDVQNHLPHDQFGFWREIICLAFVPLSPAPLGAVERFRGRVDARPLAQVVRARITSDAQRTRHGAREVAGTDGEYVFLNLQVAGTCAVEQDGRRSLVGPGQFTVVDTTTPYSTTFDGPWEMLSYRLPRTLLGGRMDAVRQVTGTTWDTTGLGSVVSAVMASTWDLVSPADAATAQVEQALVAAFGAALAQRAGEPADRHERLRSEIGREIERGLFDPDLTVATVSRRLGISPRTLHAAVSAGGETFAATVRRRRLEHAAVRLADRGSRATITEIAADATFDGPASFSRAFRRQFGMTPSDARRSGFRPHALARQH
jgi:AraC family transcriptional regulator, positive regulator of tynA and feaB